MKRALVSLLAIGFMAACGSATPAPAPTHTFTVHLALTDSSGLDILATGDVCNGSGGYSDISAGGDVTLKDGNQHIIGSTALQGGTTTDGLTCTFTATAQSVPEVSFYSLTVGHRAAVTYSLSEIKADQWTVTLDMGH